MSPIRLFIYSVLLLLPPTVRAAVFSVTSVADSGPGTLRQAILDVNAQPPGSSHRIEMSVEGITLGSALPVIAREVELSGMAVTMTWIRGNGSFRLVESSAPLTVRYVAFTGGVSSGGGGGALLAADLVLESCHFESNSALRGGAVSALTLQANDVSWIDNLAGIRGGALYVRSATGSGGRIVNSTFDRNRSDRGGAIAGVGAGVEVVSCTLTRNRATSAGAVVASESAAPWVLRHSVAAESEGSPFDATMDFQGENLLDGDPGLTEPRPVANLRHHRYPLPGSPVVNRVTASQPAIDPTNDATGAARDALPDLGALEQRMALVPENATDSADPGGLAAAMQRVRKREVNAILLPAGREILVSAELPFVDKPMYLFGQEFSTLSGGGSRRILGFPSNRVFIRGVRFDRGVSNSSVPLYTLGPSGGAIGMRGDLWLERCTFLSCSAPDHGGAIFHYGPGLLDVRDCHFSGCSSGHGGAISAIDSEVSLRNTGFVGNSATFGAALRVAKFFPSAPRLWIQHATFADNERAAPSGGVIETVGSVATIMTNSALGGNIPNDFAAFDPSGSLLLTDNLASAPSLGVSERVADDGLVYASPEPGSPLRGTAGAANLLERDQLGRPRGEDGSPDLGAVEAYDDFWRGLAARHFGREEMDDPAARAEAWGASADADGDGVENFVEWFFSSDFLDPRDVPGSWRVDPGLPGDAPAYYLEFDEARRPDIFGLVVEESADLVQFNEVDPAAVVKSPSHFPGGLATWKYEPPMATRRFFRAGFREPPVERPILVEVGSPGNAADPATLRGAVASRFLIGRFEVTWGEYADFLNAADPQGLNALGLWVSDMETSVAGGIRRDLSRPAGRRYTVLPGRSNFPVVFVNYWSALRYCNWLNNGATSASGVQAGAYWLTGAGPVPDNAASVVRESDARFFLPTTDEWYKAAYFADDNTLGGIGLWATYPVNGNTLNALAPPGDGYSANLNPGGFVLGFARAVGSYASASPFGARDMAGNVRELLQASFAGSNDIFTPGGAAFDAVSVAAKSQILNTAIFPDGRRADTGFRIAARP